MNIKPTKRTDQQIKVVKQTDTSTSPRIRREISAPSAGGRKSAPEGEVSSSKKVESREVGWSESITAWANYATEGLKDVTLTPLNLALYSTLNYIYTADNKSNLPTGLQQSGPIFPETAKPQESYHFEMEKLTPEQTKPHLRYMSLAGYAHTPKRDLIEPFGYKPMDPESIGLNLSDLPGKVEILEGSVVNNKTKETTKTEKCFVDRNTGLKILVSANPDKKEIVLAFGDMNSLIPELKEGSKKAQRQHQHAVWSNFGGKSELYQQADEVANEIIKSISQDPEYQDYKITLVGQSLGGGLAQYVGLRNGIPAMCYNAVPLGRGHQELIGDEKLKKADLLITHLSAETDYASDPRGIGMIDFALCASGIRTPGNFGKRTSIPTAYPGVSEMQKTHAFHFGSAMQHIGLDKRTLPADLIEKNPELLEA